MTDKGLDRFLVGFFSITGIVLIVYAGTQTMPLVEKIATFVFGLVGFTWAFARVFSWKSNRVKEH